MAKHYVTFQTPQGDFKWFLPTCNSNSFTIPGTSSYFSKPNYGEFCDAWASIGVDITTGQFMHYRSRLNSTTEALASYFEKISFNLPVAPGDVWKLSDDIVGTWNNSYSCQFSKTGYGVVFSLQVSYNTDQNLYQSVYCPFAYSETEDKIIVFDRDWCTIYAGNPHYTYGGPRHTFSTTTPSSIAVNASITPEEEPEPSDDPYGPDSGGGYSGSGGGPAPTGGTGTTGNGGLHDDSSDAVPTPSLPGNIATGSGLFTAYNPSASQLASFASALWNMQPTDINDVLRFLFGGDAFKAVIGLHLLPVSPSTGDSPNIKLGNWDTGVPAPKITSQYKQVSFGSVLLPEYWGNCIDYAPYTKIQLALPYIGIVDVDTDDVLGSNNTLTYNIDVLSGAICATLKCEKFNLNSVIYQWSGACAVSLPFSGASYNSVLGAIAGIAAAGMGFASMAAGPIGAALPAAALAAGGGAFGAGSAASIMGTMKGKVQKSGSFGANSGALGIMTPYFILTRPVQSVPETWQADKGYPANISAQLGNLTGYTEVSEINLECSGTEAEKKEIIDLLKNGVIF